MKYQWKSIGNPVEIQFQCKSNGNRVEISMKYKLKLIGIPVESQ